MGLVVGFNVAICFHVWLRTRLDEVMCSWMMKFYSKF